MDECLWDRLYDFCYLHCPALLDEPELFAQLHDFIHALLVAAVKAERKSTCVRNSRWHALP